MRWVPSVFELQESIFEGAQVEFGGFEVRIIYINLCDEYILVLGYHLFCNMECIFMVVQVLFCREQLEHM